MFKVYLIGRSPKPIDTFETYGYIIVHNRKSRRSFRAIEQVDISPVMQLNDNSLIVLFVLLLYLV